jgi:hypothetical protein
MRLQQQVHPPAASQLEESATQSAAQAALTVNYILTYNY